MWQESPTRIHPRQSTTDNRIEIDKNAHRSIRFQFVSRIDSRSTFRLLYVWWKQVPARSGNWANFELIVLWPHAHALKVKLNEIQSKCLPHSGGLSKKFIYEGIEEMKRRSYYCIGNDLHLTSCWLRERGREQLTIQYAMLQYANIIARTKCSVRAFI